MKIAVNVLVSLTSRLGLIQALGLMFNPFANSEKNLGRAGLGLALTILGTAALSLALEATGGDPVWATLLAVVAFPFIAWLMSKAARTLGRSPRLYGLAPLVPRLAILAFITLYNRDLDIRLSQLRGHGHEA